MSPDLTNDLKIWNTQTGAELKATQLPDWLDVRDGDYIITKINETRVQVTWSGGYVQFFNPLSKKNLASLVADDQANWLVITPKGFFDGTPAGWDQIGWRFEDNMFSYGTAELYFNDFFYPGLLEDVLADKSPRPKTGQELERIDRRQRTSPGLRGKTPGTDEFEGVGTTGIRKRHVRFDGISKL